MWNWGSMWQGYDPDLSDDALSYQRLADRLRWEREDPSFAKLLSDTGRLGENLFGTSTGNQNFYSPGQIPDKDKGNVVLNNWGASELGPGYSRYTGEPEVDWTPEKIEAYRKKYYPAKTEDYTVMPRPEPAQEYVPGQDRASEGWTGANAEDEAAANAERLKRILSMMGKFGTAATNPREYATQAVGVLKNFNPPKYVSTGMTDPRYADLQLQAPNDWVGNMLKNIKPYMETGIPDPRSQNLPIDQPNDWLPALVKKILGMMAQAPTPYQNSTPPMLSRLRRGY